VQTADIHLRAERTMAKAIAALAPMLRSIAAVPIVVLPASLDETDPVAEAVIAALPAGTSAHIVTPLSGSAARRAFFLPSQIGGWRDVRVPVPGASVDSVLLPDEIAGAATRLVAVDVVEVARHGPFVLDLLARYVHPRQRLRLVADRQRSSLVAEVAAAATPTLSLVSLSVPGGALVSATSDAIAAELVSLALAERCVGPTRAFTGPWEDAVVQRATELDLGIPMPAGIALQPAGTAIGEPWAVELLDHVRQRLGLTDA
jgi:hypothetical protein